MTVTIHEGDCLDVLATLAPESVQCAVTSPPYYGLRDYGVAGQEGARLPTSRNLRSVWTIATQPYSGAHFATMPPKLAERCIKAGSKVGDTILDPFGGAGTTGLVADRLQRDALLIELNPAYAALARTRIASDAPLFADPA